MVSDGFLSVRGFLVSVVIQAREIRTVSYDQQARFLSTRLKKL